MVVLSKKKIVVVTHKHVQSAVLKESIQSISTIQKGNMYTQLSTERGSQTPREKGLEKWCDQVE